MKARPFQVFQAAWFTVATIGLVGCEPSAPEGVLQRAGVQVRPHVLEDYAGIYRMPSGALFPVRHQDGRLFGGTPPHELLAQSTRLFTSDRLPGEFHFDREQAAPAPRMNHRLAKRDHWCERVNDANPSDPTRLVDAGGHLLRLLVIGEGEPTIVLEDGIGSGIEWQAEIQAELAKVSRVVSYDHAGTGGSQAGPGPRHALTVAHELRTALAHAGIDPPFLLVGGSIGAEYIRVFAHAFPDDTAGLVLLDPTPDWDDLLVWAREHSSDRVATYERLIAESHAAMQQIMHVQEPGRSAEWTELAVTREQARHAFPLPDVPIIQITGAVGRDTSVVMSDKVRFFDDWLKDHVPTARHVLAPHSAHGVPVTDAALMVEHVRGIVQQHRRR
jgi:pimeloyl-ACP methyl ester carboxylesterase